MITTDNKKFYKLYIYLAMTIKKNFVLQNNGLVLIMTLLLLIFSKIFTASLRYKIFLITFLFYSSVSDIIVFLNVFIHTDVISIHLGLKWLNWYLISICDHLILNAVKTWLFESTSGYLHKILLYFITFWFIEQ